MWAEGVFFFFFPFVLVMDSRGLWAVVMAGGQKCQVLEILGYRFMSSSEYADMCLSFRRTTHVLMADCRNRMDNVLGTERYFKKSFLGSVIVLLA